MMQFQRIHRLTNESLFLVVFVATSSGPELISTNCYLQTYRNSSEAINMPFWMGPNEFWAEFHYFQKGTFSTYYRRDPAPLSTVLQNYSFGARYSGLQDPPKEIFQRKTFCACATCISGECLFIYEKPIWCLQLAVTSSCPLLFRSLWGMPIFGFPRAVATWENEYSIHRTSRPSCPFGIAWTRNIRLLVPFHGLYWYFLVLFDNFLWHLILSSLGWSS